MSRKAADTVYDASIRGSGTDIPVHSTINDRSGLPNQLLVAIISGNVRIPEEPQLSQPLDHAGWRAYWTGQTKCQMSRGYRRAKQGFSGSQTKKPSQNLSTGHIFFSLVALRNRSPDLAWVNSGIGNHG